MDSKIPNHLANEKSPYLLQHKFNPINWYPWSDEAFTKAKQEDKPIFLSIGYSTCHWCHVMAEESFEDQEVAKLMNDVFISIKVDREEHPDVDNTYMRICQMITGTGGWPLTIIMDADKKPFFAGTYFPKHNQYGRIGLIELIAKIKVLWLNEREKLLTTRDEVIYELTEMTNPIGEAFTVEILEDTFKELEMDFDEQYGGFQEAPKFPTPHKLFFLLRYWKQTKNEKALIMVEKTLLEIRKGGIYDHVGFGFHRYSTDSKWRLPHFEKMLYDQALLAIAYLETFQITKKAIYRQIAQEIFTYILGEMTDANGGFYSAEDADSEKIEGKFYTWSLDELNEILDKDELAKLISIYGLKKEGNFKDQATQSETGRNILYLEKNFTILAENNHLLEHIENIEKIRQKLYLQRNNRIHPLKDDKILTDWNGLMIAALAIGGRILGEKKYIEVAEKASNFILKNMLTNDGRLLHRYWHGDKGIQGMVDDYSFFIWGLLELYQSSFKVDYLLDAIRFNKILIQYFWDEEDGGLFFTPKDNEKLLIHNKEIYDGALPSGNAISLLNFIKIARITGDFDLENKTIQMNKTFSTTVEQALSAHTMFVTALQYIFGDSYEIVIVGDMNSGNTKEMLNLLAMSFIPNMIVIFIPTNQKGSKIFKIGDLKKYKKNRDGETLAYICSNRICKTPTNNISQMMTSLKIEK